MHLTDLVLLTAFAIVAAVAVFVVAYELWTIFNDEPGDTISARTMHHFKTKTRRGALTFLGCLYLVGSGGLAFLIWYSAHIVSQLFV